MLSTRSVLALTLLLAVPLAAQRPTAKGGAKLYITNQGGASVTVIDQSRLAVDTVIDLTQLGFSANAKPHHATVERDGSFWYVSLIGDGKVLKFDRANRLVGQVSMATPGLVYLDPVHDSLYVGRSMTAPNPPKSLAVIKRSTFTLVEEQEIQIARPHALAATRDGKWVHTASLADNSIASVETATGRVTLTTLPGAFRSLVQFTMSPDGKWMVAGGELSNSVLVFDLTKPPPFVPAREIPVAGRPWDPAYSRNGKLAYFSLFTANAVAEVDLATGTVKRTFTGDLRQPYDVILRADGKYLFVVNQNTGAVPLAQSAHDNMPGMAGKPELSATSGWLSVIDVASGKIIKTLMLGTSPTGMGAAGAR